MQIKIRRIPFVFSVEQMPQGEDIARFRAEIGNNIVLYWSEEEAEAWKVGIPVTHPHPIDIRVFKGYNPTIKSAITIATRPISSWGLQLKGWYILKEAYHKIPIQVIAHGDTEFPNAHGIYSEEEMVKTLASHQVYFNCGWKMDRSTLEAAAVGMPIVAIRKKQNVYLNQFIDHQNILYADSPQEMIELTKQLLDNKELCCELGVMARSAIRQFWSPTIAKEKWNYAFKRALEKGT